MHGNSVKAAELMTTGWCPSSCSYCYIPKTSEMKEMHESLKGQLGEMLERTDKVFSGVEYLSFWGTEPLLTLEKFGLEEVDARFPQLKEISFSTSLLVQVETLINFLNESDSYDFDVDVQVSVDGPYTNENRMEGAVERIRDNLKRLLGEADAEYTLRWKSTITPENVRDMNRHGVNRYFDFFEEFSEVVRERVDDKVDFHDSFAPTLMVPGRYSQQDGKEFATFLSNLHEQGYDSTYTPRLKQLFDKGYGQQIRGRPYTATCSGGDSQLGYDGEDVHVCHRTFYLNKDEYVESVKDQNQEENWDVSHFKSGSINQLRNEFMADPQDEDELTRFQYLMRNYHDYWQLKMEMDKALLLEMADAGQVDARYSIDGSDEARDLLVLFLNTGLSCPVESVLNTNTLFATPISEIRMFANGAMQELEQRVGEII